MEAEITSSRPEDLNAVLALLADASLPGEGVAEHFRHFLVAKLDGRVVGSIGMELYGPNVLLRSLVVVPSHRGRGLGRTLTERLLQEARKRRAQRLFLLTDTAEEFFRKFGFKPIARDEADAAIQESVEFRIACCESTVCMRLDL